MLFRSFINYCFSVHCPPRLSLTRTPQSFSSVRKTSSRHIIQLVISTNMPNLFRSIFLVFLSCTICARFNYAPICILQAIDKINRICKHKLCTLYLIYITKICIIRKTSNGVKSLLRAIRFHLLALGGIIHSIFSRC